MPSPKSSFASRFSGFGMGARRGSGFQNYQNQATADFAQDLQSKRLSLQQQAIKDLHGMSQDLLGNEPYDLMKDDPENKKKPWWQKLLGGAAPLIGAGAGAFFGGPGGAAAGYKLGSSFGEAFN